MSNNIGKADRVLRVVLGIVMVGAGVFTPGSLSMVLIALGAIPLLTGSVGYCPVYSVAKINTCKCDQT